MTEQAKLQKHAKGSRPYFFDDPAVDQLLAMLLALSGEVSVMRDRQDTVERLLEEKGTISIDDIEAYEPSPEVMAERDERREQYLRHILRIVDTDTAEFGHNDLSQEWQRVMEVVHEPD